MKGANRVRRNRMILKSPAKNKMAMISCRVDAHSDADCISGAVVV